MATQGKSGGGKRKIGRNKARCAQYKASRTRENNKARRMGLTINQYLSLSEKNELRNYQQTTDRSKTRAELRAENMGISPASYTQLRRFGLLGDWNRYDLAALNEGRVKVLPKYEK